jgi:hypothetical protein
MWRRELTISGSSNIHWDTLAKVIWRWQERYAAWNRVTASDSVCPLAMW